MQDALTAERLGSTTGAVFFKFEPFVLHVQARSLAAGRRLLAAALQAGMRNSGMLLGRHRLMLAVRMTLKLEAPVALDGQLLVADDYLQLLVRLANDMFAENASRTERFFQQLRRSVEGREMEAAEPAGDGQDVVVVVEDAKRLAGLAVGRQDRGALYASHYDLFHPHPNPQASGRAEEAARTCRGWRWRR